MSSLLGRFSGSALAWLFALALVAATVIYIMRGQVPPFMQGIALALAGGAAGAHVPTVGDTTAVVEPTYVPPDSSVA